MSFRNCKYLFLLLYVQFPVKVPKKCSEQNKIFKMLTTVFIVQ